MFIIIIQQIQNTQFEILESDDAVAKQKLIELSEILQQKPEVQSNIPLLQSATVLHFVTKQLTGGNSDLITKRMIRESCNYVLNTLVITY